jgi:hypothetical protein
MAFKELKIQIKSKRQGEGGTLTFAVIIITGKKIYEAKSI